MALPTRYPGAVWRPVRNWSGTLSGTPRGLIAHVQQGNGSLYGWFNTPATEVSAHLWVSKKGLVEQYVELDKRAWAQAAGNPYWLSVECEGFVEEDYTPAQVQRLAEIYAWGMETYGWPAQITDSPDRPGLGTHRMGGVAWGGHSCPGDLRADRRVLILSEALALHERRVLGGDMPLTVEDADLIVSRMWARLGLQDAVPLGQTTPGGTIGETLRTVQFLVNALGLAMWHGGLPTMADRIGTVGDGVRGAQDELGRIGSHLGDQGPLVAVLAGIRAELVALRGELAQRTVAGGADVGPLVARLDGLAAQIAGLTLTAVQR